MNAQDFLQVLRSRRSVRAFEPRPPERAVLEQLFEAAQWAPSNHNRQGWKFLVFTDRHQIAELSQKVGQCLQEMLQSSGRLLATQGQELLHFATLFDKAPVMILAMHKKSPAIGKALIGESDTRVSSEALSAAMAVQNLLLAAHVLGLGACVMTAPLLARRAWESLSDLSAGFEPTCVIAMGYPSEQPGAPRRKSVQHIVEYR